MTIKKTLIKVGIGIGISIFIIISILLINTFTSTCEENHLLTRVYFNSSKEIYTLVDYKIKLNLTDTTIYDEKYCRYTTETFCRESEIKYGSICLYKPDGFFENIAGIILLIFLSIFLLSGFGFYFYKKFKLPIQVKETVVYWDRAKELINQWICKEHHIYHWFEDEKLNFRRNAIRWFNEQQDYSRNNEKLMRAQVEINEGDEPGIYTCDVNLSRNEDWIKNGNFIFKRVPFELADMKLQQMPRNEPKDVLQQRLEKLSQLSPEAASKFEERLLEQEVERLKEPSTIKEDKIAQSAEQQTLQQGQQQVPPWYKKRYDRRRN